MMHMVSWDVGFSFDLCYDFKTVYYFLVLFNPWKQYITIEWESL